MNKEEIHIKIRSILEQLELNNQRISEIENRFSQIEIDMMRKQTIELYENINALHFANINSKVTESKNNEQAVKPIIKEIKIEHTAAPKIEVVKNEPIVEIVKHEPIKEIIISEPIIEEKPIPLKTNKIVEQTIESNTLNNIIGHNKEKKELAQKFVNSKIETIKSGIDLSKRFELQSNLFLNDHNAYNDAISKLDNASNLEKALYIFETELTTQYKWNIEDELVSEFKSLIYRKF